MRVELFRQTRHKRNKIVEAGSEFRRYIATCCRTKDCTVLIKMLQMALPAAVAMSLSASTAFAAPLPSRHILTLEMALTVAAAAEAKTNAESWPYVISMVDADGLAIVLVRMDDAAVLTGVDLAPGKARTAALFRRESGARLTG